MHVSAEKKVSVMVLQLGVMQLSNKQQILALAITGDCILGCWPDIGTVSRQLCQMLMSRSFPHGELRHEHRVTAVKFSVHLTLLSCKNSFALDLWKRTVFNSHSIM